MPTQSHYQLLTDPLKALTLYMASSKIATLVLLRKIILV